MADGPFPLTGVDPSDPRPGVLVEIRYEQGQGSGASSARSVVLLGHSWGAVLAVEYALRNPTRVSRLILMNPAPVSVGDLAAVRKLYLEQLGEAMDRQRALVASAAYQAGDPEAVAARYRIHFQPSLKRSEHYETMMARMKEMTCQCTECGRNANGWTSARYTDGNAAVPQTPALMRSLQSERTNGSGL